MKNLYAKTRPVDQPYEVWESFDGTWTWKVLKKWQVADDKPYARWFCAVSSPYTHGGYDLGDCYVTDITSNAHCVQVEGAKVVPPPYSGASVTKLYALAGPRSIASGDTWAASEVDR
jgi:hypothetical protein